MEEPSNYNNYDEKYKESIKFSMDSGNYFKDAFSWYSLTYIQPIVDRTLLLFASIISIFIIYNVSQLITTLLPLKEDIYVVIREKDLSVYQTSIYDLSKNNDTLTTNEDILRYLLINYVEERESHNYKSANVNDMNHKLKVIENNSSSDVYNEFKIFMSRNNVGGPYYFFGKDVETTVKIDSFKFIRIDKKGWFSKLKDYFNVDILPVRAEVYYTLNTQIGNKTTSQKRKAVISFEFSGVATDKKTGKYLPIKFKVISYKNYDLK